MICKHANRTTTAKLLVIDNDDSVRLSLQKLLETEHYQVCSARDATEALALVQSEPVDLVILDVNIGADGGWDTRQRIIAVSPAAGFIMMTADRDQQQRALAPGAEALLEKPIDVSSFLQTIRTVLAKMRQ